MMNTMNRDREFLDRAAAPHARFSGPWRCLRWIPVPMLVFFVGPASPSLAQLTESAHVLNTGEGLSANEPGSVTGSAWAKDAVTSAKIVDRTIGDSDLDANTFWRLDGNSGTTIGTDFFGTTDNAPIEIRVNNMCVLRLEPNLIAPNLIGGTKTTAEVDAVGATIGGGADHSVAGAYSTISGGTSNRANADFATVGGGRVNTSTGEEATIAGGVGNIAGGTRSTIAGGTDNLATAWNTTVGGGSANTASHAYATVAGGLSNISSGVGSAIAGGQMNLATTNGAHSAIGGGIGNVASGPAATIAGGDHNTAVGVNSTVGGGWTNSATGRFSTIGGGISNQSHSLATTICGGLENLAEREFSVVGGGRFNSAKAAYATISGGEANTAAHTSTIGGGFSNFASRSSTVGGGVINQAMNFACTISGGKYNTANGTYSVVGGGAENVASGSTSTVGGGTRNDADGIGATVPGGISNRADGDHSFAAGTRALAIDDGAFVWADSSGNPFSSSGPDQFLVRASGGVHLYSSSNLSSGVVLAPGSGAWSSLCDRNAKENIHPIDEVEILERLAALPISIWNYKTEDDEIRHIGPMAQDFRQAFALGQDAKFITTIDSDGVALAAIQGLHKLVQRKDAQVVALMARIEDLEERVHSVVPSY